MSCVPASIAARRRTASWRTLRSLLIVVLPALACLFAPRAVIPAAGILYIVLAAGALAYKEDRTAPNRRLAALLVLCGLFAGGTFLGRPATTVNAARISAPAARRPPPAAHAPHPVPVQTPVVRRQPLPRVTVLTTAYCLTGLTASGAWTRYGTIAATLPFGTRIWVPGYGHGTVLDRGGAVGPGHLDLYMPDCNQALRWGRRILTVEIG